MRIRFAVLSLAAALIASASYVWYARLLPLPAREVQVAVERTEVPTSRPLPASPVDPLKSAWAQVQARPRDPLAWLNLGEAQVARDQLEAAQQSYRNAIRFGARDGNTYARLGFILYAHQQDDEALGLLREAKRLGAQVPLLDWTIETLLQKAVEDAAPAKRVGTGTGGSSASGIPPPQHQPDTSAEPSHEASFVPQFKPTGGLCEIPIERQPVGQALVLRADIGGLEATLILDTGATRTVLTAEFAARAEIPVDYGRAVQALTANGWVQQPTAVVPEIVVAERIVSDTRIAVCESCENWTADGLLGLDVQSLLGMQLDLANQRIRFADCWE